MRAGLAVCGNVSIDVIDGGPPTVGGGPFHCGLGLRLLERPATIVAKCAPGDRPLVAPALARIGVPVALVDAERTASFELRYEGEARHAEIREVGDSWSAADVASLGDARWVHVAPLTCADFPAETLAALARGRRVSYDGQGLVREPEPGPVRYGGGFDAEVLRHVSYLKLAEEEALALLPNLAADTVLGLGAPEVVVTLGSRGSIVYAAGAATPVPCHPILDVDLTGCGDVFGIGYLAARSDGLGPVAAARRATALVALLLTNRKRVR